MMACGRASIGPCYAVELKKTRCCAERDYAATMSFEDDLCCVEEHIAEARRLVQRQKGIIVWLRAAGANTLDAQRILWLLEANLLRFEEHRDRLRGNMPQ